MSTVWCLSVAFLTPWVVGTPVAWLARGCRPLRPGDWYWVPFFGLAAVVFPLQNLVVFADLPIARTAPWFWAATGAAWGALIARASGRRSLHAIPWRIVAVALAVYVGQGAGVVVRGVERYRGDLQSDQYSYVVLGQFLADEPFSTDARALDGRPWLGLPMLSKPDRLGQSVIHGFFTATAGRDAIDLFFPTLLLGPALLAPAMLLLVPQCGLPRRWALWTAATAGCAPGVEVLVSLCFLSHALCVPILVAFLAGASRLGRGGRPLAGAITAFVLGVSVYTEFVPLFVGVAGVALTAGVVRRHIRPARAAAIGTVLVLSLGLNPAAVAGAKSVWERSANTGVTRTTGHRTAVWVGAVWLPFEKSAALALKRPAPTFSNAVLYGSLAASAFGGVALAARAARSGRRLLPSLACAALMLPPAAVWLKQPEAAYAVGKLVLTLTPVLVLFIACGAYVVLRGRYVPRLLGLGFLAVLGVQSGLEQWTWQRDGHDVGQARTWNEPDLQRLCAPLREHEPAAVVIALTDDDPQAQAIAIRAMWYYGRRHRIRLVGPRLGWTSDPAEYPVIPRREADALPAGTLIATRCDAPPLRGNAYEVVFENRTYRLLRVIEPSNRE